MQAVGAALRWLARAIAQVAGYWRADIGKRRTCVGKGASVGIGVLALCCGMSLAVSAVTSVGQRVGVLPTWTPVPPTAAIARLAAAPTAAPATEPAASPSAAPATAAPARAPSATQVPTATAEATAAPTRTPAPKPTARPTEAPAATETPAPPTAEAPTAAPAAAPAPPAEVPTAVPAPSGGGNGSGGDNGGSGAGGVPPTDAYTCPTDHPIKGNIRKKDGRKLYHLPGEGSYDQTKPEACFATRGEAEAAGYVYSSR